MRLTPDAVVIWQWGPVSLNATILFTWFVMAILTGVSILITRSLTSGESMSRRQNLLESLVSIMSGQVRDVARQDPGKYLPFVGTLFLFIAMSNLLAIVPGYMPPTGSLSTTTALAICVFIAVPLYGIASQGLIGYMRLYVQPTVIMLPFNILGELSRTVALAFRLYGNIMSGTFIAAIFLGLAPLFFPIIMQALGLLTGMIQAYIFAVLAMVYIASATAVHEKTAPPGGERRENNSNSEGEK